MKTIRAEARRLLELAVEDEDLRADLRALAQEILASTSSIPTSEDNAVDQDSAEPLRELTLGQSRPLAMPSSRDRESPPKPSYYQTNIDTLEARCRRKAEAARWAAESHRRMGEG